MGSYSLLTIEVRRTQGSAGKKNSMNGLDPETGPGPPKNVRLNSLRGEERQQYRRCPSWVGNFNTYFTLGMIGFFVFWGTLLLQIWPPSRYWPAADFLWSSESVEANSSKSINVSN